MDIKKYQKLKVGVLIQSFKMNKFQKEIIDFLSLEQNIELYAIYDKKKINNFSEKIFYALKKNSLLRNFEIFFFKIIIFFEEFLLRKKYKYLEELDENYLVKKNQFIEILYVDPIYSKKGIFSEYNSDDYKKIKNKNLDLIVRINVSEIFRNNKLKISNLGILSFHHGDNSWNRGGPPGFWEVFLNKPETGFIIQFLNESLDNGKILFKGEFATKKLFSLNKYNLLRESNHYLIEVIKKILYDKNNKIYKNILINSKIYKVPSFFETLEYVYRKFILFIKLLNYKYLKNKKQRWFVSYTRENFDKIELKNSLTIKNPKNAYFADPFVIKFKNNNYIFVEDYSYKKEKGSISVIEIDQNDNKKVFRNIIEEPFHMSFPFVFKYEDNFYMIPETHEANSVRLYKCSSFPDKWVYSHDLISNTRCVDSILIKKDSLFYLINTFSIYDDFSSRLNVYYSESPISKNWTNHKLNPVYFNIKSGRNGGLLFQNEKIIRVAQTCGLNHLGDFQYGTEILLNNIISLSEGTFKEEFITSIKPNFKKNLLGVHHMSGIQNFTAFDYCKYDKIT